MLSSASPGMTGRLRIRSGRARRCCCCELETFFCSIMSFSRALIRSEWLPMSNWRAFTSSLTPLTEDRRSSSVAWIGPSALSWSRIESSLASELTGAMLTEKILKCRTVDTNLTLSQLYHKKKKCVSSRDTCTKFDSACVCCHRGRGVEAD